MSKALHDLHNVPFQVAEIFDDVDDKLYVFDCLYEDILGEHAPLKQVRIRGNQVPFMKEQWRKAIRQKNRLWKRFIRERTDTNYELYKRQRNICTSLRRKAIKTFFDKKSESENPREFWDTYRPFLHSRKSTQANDIILKEHDVVITDKKQMAELLIVILSTSRTACQRLLNRVMEKSWMRILAFRRFSTTMNSSL